jgi:carbamoyl-phosphate synthase large subunit
MKNILLLSAGRRVELAQAFKSEIASRNLNAKILATDFKPEFSAACQIVDEHFNAPPVTDSTYPDFLFETCLKNHVALVIPCIDTELVLLAELREKFETHGIHLIISDSMLVRSCRDKRITADVFMRLGIHTPKIYRHDAILFPCFSKPFDGSSSINSSLVRDKTELSDVILSNEKMMFMEFIDSSYSEFTIDAYYDRMGVLQCLVPRQRLEVRAGEVSKAVTRRHFVYDYLLPKLRMLKGARGCLTLQFFANEQEKLIVALEINPRFGGGFPLSYCAGANYPGWLIDEYLLQRKVSFFEDWEANLLMLRYDAKVLLHDVA